MKQNVFRDIVSNLFYEKIANFERKNTHSKSCGIQIQNYFISPYTYIGLPIKINKT